MAVYKYADLSVGMSSIIETRISDYELDSYVKLTKDTNPLHCSKGYANEKGFPDRVVHGALILGFMSQLVGVKLEAGQLDENLSHVARFKIEPW